ncbi:MAG TPA: hypothetical protein VFU02_08965 [Polyangiaceae bacterium]|nr:hypothetical protein [Polyangiaceae bacterium]
MLKRTLLASSVPLMLLGACGGDSDDDGGFDAGLPLAEVPAAYASVFCDLTERCNPFFKAFIPGNECEDYFISTLNAQGFDDIVDAVEDDRAIYNGEKMQDCLDELSARSCDEIGDPDPESCDEAATGTVERGGDCTTDIECEGDSICQFSDGCPGTCTGKLNAGDTCSGDDQCDDGLVCSGDTQRCVAPAQEGDDCDGGVAPPCASDALFCLGDDEEAGTAGTCHAADEVFTGKPGDECDFEEGPLCEDGSACAIVDLDPLTLECVEVAESGEDCPFGAPNSCEAGSYCAGSASPRWISREPASPTPNPATTVTQPRCSCADLARSAYPPTRAPAASPAKRTASPARSTMNVGAKTASTVAAHPKAPAASELTARQQPAAARARERPLASNACSPAPLGGGSPPSAPG